MISLEDILLDGCLDALGSSEFLLYQPDEGADERITSGDVETTVTIPEDVENAAKRVNHADIESAKIAKKILENTEAE